MNVDASLLMVGSLGLVLWGALAHSAWTMHQKVQRNARVRELPPGVRDIAIMAWALERAAVEEHASTEQLSRGVDALVYVRDRYLLKRLGVWERTWTKPPEVPSA